MSSSPTVLDRVVQYHPELSIDGLLPHTALIDSAFAFFQARECRPADRSSHTHVNYGGVARSWYSSISGRFAIDPDSLQELHTYIVRLWRIGLPLQLVECRERLESFPFYLDLDVKIDGLATEESCLKFEDEELIGAKTGFRLLRLLVRILHHTFPENAQKTLSVAVFSATKKMTSSSSASKISLRLVFPHLVVDKERAVVIREAIVDKLNYLGREDNQSPYVRDLKRKLLKLSVSNHFRNVLDETAIRCRHGLRMVFNEKTVNGAGVGRVFVPVAYVTPEPTNNRIEALVAAKKFDGDTTDEDNTIGWIRMGSLVTPVLSHSGELTAWKEAPIVRPSRTTRTGPGGSSLSLANFTTNDAVRAANRFKENTAANQKETMASAQFEWVDGSIPLFKRRIPIGIDGETEILGDTISWKLTKRRNNCIVFDDATKTISVTAPSSETLKQLVRIVEKFPNVVVKKSATSPKKISAPVLAPPPPAKKLAVMLKTFKAEGDGELGCSEGEQVEIVEEEDEGWVAVKRVSDGTQGFVPAAYLKQL